MMVTANVPFTLSRAAARVQVDYLLRQDPSMLLLHEVPLRDVGALVGAPGRWGVWQPSGSKGASAIVRDAGTFTATQRGAELGFRGRYDRRMTWAILESGPSQQAMVGLHMPTDSSKARDNAPQLPDGDRELPTAGPRLPGAGYSLVIGGDGNHPLDWTREPWSPVRPAGGGPVDKLASREALTRGELARWAGRRHNPRSTYAGSDFLVTWGWRGTPS